MLDWSNLTDVYFVPPSVQLVHSHPSSGSIHCNSTVFGVDLSPQTVVSVALEHFHNCSDSMRSVQVACYQMSTIAVIASELRLCRGLEPIDSIAAVAAEHRMLAIVARIEYDLDLAEAVLAVAMAKRTKHVTDNDIDCVRFDDGHAFDMVWVCKSDNCILAVESLRVGKYRI